MATPNQIDVPEDYKLLDAIMRFEGNELNEDETLVLFQHLVNTGLAWKQDSYGREALRLIEAGHIG